MNKQLIFDTAVAGIRKQGKRSVNDFGRCVYRSLNDCKCAVGHLIPDDKYVSYIENLPATRPSVLQRIDKKFDMSDAPTLNEKTFFQELQQCHDLGDFGRQPEMPKGFAQNEEFYVEAAFERFAKHHGLKYTREAWTSN